MQKAQRTYLLSSMEIPRLSWSKATMYAEEKQYCNSSSSSRAGCFIFSSNQSPSQNRSPANTKSERNDPEPNPKNYQKKMRTIWGLWEYTQNKNLD